MLVWVRVLSRRVAGRVGRLCECLAPGRGWVCACLCSAQMLVLLLFALGGEWGDESSCTIFHCAAGSLHLIVMGESAAGCYSDCAVEF